MINLKIESIRPIKENLFYDWPLILSEISTFYPLMHIKDMRQKF